MGVEIERKFLVRQGWTPEGEGLACTQGYLALQSECTVRVRVIGEEAFLTVKGAGTIRRLEYEYAVPVADARELLDLCGGRTVEKQRYPIVVGEHVWDVDWFEGRNAGLITAEVELADEQEAFERPEWLGEEVTGVSRYVNAVLARQPFSTWSAEEREQCGGGA